MEVVNKEVMFYAEKIFGQNLSRYGFSFLPKSLYLEAFDKDGNLYENWKTRIESKKPDPREHPDLYNSLRVKKEK